MKPQIRVFRVAVASAVWTVSPVPGSWAAPPPDLDARVRGALQAAGFTGRVQSTLEHRLGRPVNRKMANLGRLLWFDTLVGLHRDNTCGGCRSPAHAFGDRSIAIGVQNNNLVARTGRARNQRRTPTTVNTAIYPNLMERTVLAPQQPVRQLRDFLFPPLEGAAVRPRSHRDPLPDRTGPHPADRAGGSGRVHRHRVIGLVRPVR
jgi:cytochrome c peroxidase